MLRAGDLVKWIEPIEAEYSYGTVVAVNGNYVKIKGQGYYHGTYFEVFIGHIRKVHGGKQYGGSKKSGKRAVIEAEL